MAKPFTKRDYINMILEESHRRELLANKTEVNEQAQEIEEKTQDLLQRKYTREDNLRKFQKFSEESKISLLSECIYKIYNEVLSNTSTSKEESISKEAIGRNLINKFIEENGINNLLGSFKTISPVLCEMSNMVENYHKKIIEAVDKNNEDSFMIDPLIRDDFYDELDIENPQDVIIAIRSRVSNAVEEFINANNTDRIEIKTVLQDTQDKVNATKDDSLKESYEQKAKRDIASIRNRRIKNVFSLMVENMSSSIYNNDDLKEYYLLEGGRLNIDKIVESCELMYTFLETVNSLKMVKVDEEYIGSILESMKA